MAWGGGLSAQQGANATVLGRVLDQETRTPQVGAFVALLESDGTRRGAVLTDETGRYVLRAPAPGRYRLRAERIGMESHFSQEFQVTPGQVVALDLETRPAAVALAGVEVTGESRCSLDAGEGSATVRLWEEARKALEVADWAESAGYVYQTRTFQRSLTRDGRVLEEQSQLGTQAGQGAFRSLEPELLVSRGFIQEEEGAQVYYAPDAAALLSDAFLSTHCFRAVREDGELGLAFEPAPGRRVTDIRGTLWFSGEGALDRMEFDYLGVRDVPDAGEGEIVFRRLEEGAWIVTDWRIRMPRWEVEETPTGERRNPQLVGTREVGGQVRSARRVESVTVFDARQGAVRGTVSGAPQAGGGEAQVYLSGTGYAAPVAGDGSFLLEGVPPGIYDLVLDHPGLQALAAAHQARPVEVVADSVAVVTVDFPSREEVLQGRCQDVPLLTLVSPDTRDAGEPAVLGGVVRDLSGQPLAQWPVRVRWTQAQTTLAATRERWRGTVVFTDARGGWAACGLPTGLYVGAEPAQVQLSRDAAAAGEGTWGRGEAVGRLGAGDRVWVELVRGAGSN